MRTTFRRRARPGAPPEAAHVRRGRAANPACVPDPLRVLAVGDDAIRLAWAATVVADDGNLIHHVEAHGPRTIDAVVLGVDASPTRHRALLDDASVSGVPVVRVPRRPVIDVREVNPTGWRRQTEPTVGIRLAHPDRARSWAAIERLVDDIDPHRCVVLLEEPWRRDVARGLATQPLPADPRRRATILHELRGVVDAPDLHDSVPSRAAWLTEMTARGVPTVAGDLADLRGFLAEPLAHALATACRADLDDPDRRELLSTIQRRAALRHHGAPGVWRELADAAGLPAPPPPTISVLLATNRPGRLIDAVRRVDRQSYPRLELIVALHGDVFPTDIATRVAAATARSFEVVQVGADRPLGDVLNTATNVATGDLVAKMDDDDLYDVDHLLDLVDTLRYSGATLVGKGSEFVYLEEVDTTIRRFPRGAESANRNLAGGTLLLGRADLADAGRWQRAPSAVDQRLIDDVERIGGRIHRTHGHGFVLYRHDEGHTWNASVDYFLRQAVSQWQGLALEPAGIR